MNIDKNVAQIKNMFMGLDIDVAEELIEELHTSLYQAKKAITSDCLYEKEALLNARGGYVTAESIMAYCSNIIDRTGSFDQFPGLDELSESLIISTQSIRRRLNCSGYSWVTLKYSLRISHAVNLMTNTNRTIEDIAMSCGLHDSSALSRLFKEVVGTTPAKYRKSIGQ